MKNEKRARECCTCDYKCKIVLYKSLAGSIVAERKLSNNKKNICSLRTKHERNVISSGGTSKYFIFIVRRKRENVLGNAILLHVAAITEKVHFIHLILILRLHFLFLSCKPSLKIPYFFPLGHKSSSKLLHLFL